MPHDQTDDASALEDPPAIDPVHDPLVFLLDQLDDAAFFALIRGRGFGSDTEAFKKWIIMISQTALVDDLL